MAGGGGGGQGGLRGSLAAAWVREESGRGVIRKGARKASAAGEERGRPDPRPGRTPRCGAAAGVAPRAWGAMAGGIGGEGMLDEAHYDALKAKVAALRESTRATAAATRARREVESAELLEAEVSWGAERVAMSTEIAQLKHGLQEGADARQAQSLQLERSVRAADERVRREQEARHRAEAEAQAALAEASERHAAEIEEVRRQLKAELEVALTTAEGWRQKCEVVTAMHEAELLRVREGSVDHLREVISSEEEWRARAEQAVSMVSTLEEELAKAKAHAMKAENDLALSEENAAATAAATEAAAQETRARVEWLLGELQAEVKNRETEVAVARADSAELLSAAKERHEAEMESVRVRVEALVKRKNETIRKVRASAHVQSPACALPRLSVRTGLGERPPPGRSH